MKNLTKEKSGIYIITNLVNQKYYIGSTSEFKSRCRSHRTLLKRNKHFNKHLQSAVNKYGLVNFTFNCLEVILADNFQSNEEFTKFLTNREEFYIQQMNATDPKYGYNARVECTSNIGLKWSEESKRKFSESKKGKPLSSNTLKAVREAAKKRKGKPNFGFINWYKNLSEEEKENFRNTHAEILRKGQEVLKKRLHETGCVFTSDQLSKLRKSKNCRTIYCYQLTGEFVNSFETCIAIQEFLGKNKKNSHIKKCIDHRIYYGYFWSYNQYDVLPYSLRLQYLNNTILESTVKPVIQYDLNHQFIKHWDTLNDAAISLGFKKSTPIRNAILKNKSIKNYYFEYIEPYTSDCIGKPDELLESLEEGNQQPSFRLKSKEGSETNSII